MRQSDGEDKTMAIFSKSLDLFMRNGYEETTLRMIQKATGLHSGSIYYVINGKESILSNITEAFLGDIMCRSSRISRERGDGRLAVLLPPAFLLFASSESRCLSRLMSQAFRIGSQMEIVLVMAEEWASRCAESGDGARRRHLLTFFYGGVASLISSDCTFEDGIEAMLRFSPPVAGDPEPGLGDVMRRCVSSEGLPFMGRPIGQLDSEYGVDDIWNAEKA